MDDKFVCYGHFTLMEMKCIKCRDVKICQIDTLIRKEGKDKKDDIKRETKDGRSCEDRV